MWTTWNWGDLLPASYFSGVKGRTDSFHVACAMVSCCFIRRKRQQKEHPMDVPVPSILKWSGLFSEMLLFQLLANSWNNLLPGPLKGKQYISPWSEKGLAHLRCAGTAVTRQTCHGKTSCSAACILCIDVPSPPVTSVLLLFPNALEHR